MSSPNVLFDLPSSLIASVFELLRVPEIVKLDSATARGDYRSCLTSAYSLHQPVVFLERDGFDVVKDRAAEKQFDWLIKRHFRSPEAQLPLSSFTLVAKACANDPSALHDCHIAVTIDSLAVLFSLGAASVFKNLICHKLSLNFDGESDLFLRNTKAFLQTTFVKEKALTIKMKAHNEILEIVNLSPQCHSLVASVECKAQTAEEEEEEQAQAEQEEEEDEEEQSSQEEQEEEVAPEPKIEHLLFHEQFSKLISIKWLNRKPCPWLAQLLRLSPVLELFHSAGADHAATILQCSSIFMRELSFIQLNENGAILPDFVARLSNCCFVSSINVLSFANMDERYFSHYIRLLTVTKNLKKLGLSDVFADEEDLLFLCNRFPSLELNLIGMEGSYPSLYSYLLSKSQAQSVASF